MNDAMVLMGIEITEDMIRDQNYVKHKYEGKPVFNNRGQRRNNEKDGC